MTAKQGTIEVKKGVSTPQAPTRQPLLSLRSQIDRLFDDFSGSFGRDVFPTHLFDVPAFPKWASEIEAGIPAVDVVDEEKAYRVTAELPGMTEKDIEVTKDGEVLTIRGEKKEEKETKEKGYFLSERRYGSYLRTLRLPNGIDDSKIEAKAENGVLTILLPKTPETISKPKKIEIKSGK
jgi:HSP20 family protein